jgi:nucleoside-diphosphate-sugar epimerase
MDRLRSLHAFRRAAPAGAPAQPARPVVPGGRVLITGASGLIGQILREDLGSSHSLQGIDRQADTGVRRVDMRRLGRLVAAFEGIDTVIDLAANSDADASWREAYANNLRITINALEAARLTRVRRVVFASSNHVMGLAERDDPYARVLAGRYEGLDPDTLPRLSPDAPVRPDGPYGIAKAAGEAAGRFYAERHGLSVLCLRIGTVNHANRPTNQRQFSTLLTRRDLVSLVEGCLAAPESLRFGIYFGVSANRWRIWEIENARGQLGYRPVDDAEQWR